MNYDEIVVIAGDSYAKIVREVFKGKKISAPLTGLGGGYMLSALERAIRKCKELQP